MDTSHVLNLLSHDGNACLSFFTGSVSVYSLVCCLSSPGHQPQVRNWSWVPSRCPREKDPPVGRALRPVGAVRMSLGIPPNPSLDLRAGRTWMPSWPHLHTGAQPGRGMCPNSHSQSSELPDSHSPDSMPTDCSSLLGHLSDPPPPQGSALFLLSFFFFFFWSF